MIAGSIINHFTSVKKPYNVSCGSYGMDGKSVEKIFWGFLILL